MKLLIKIIIHSIFWIVFESFSLCMGIMDESLHAVRMNSDLLPHLIINTIWAFAIFYLFYFYFIRFFENRQFFKYLLYSILVSFTLTICVLPIHKLIYSEFHFFNPILILTTTTGTFILAQCGSLIRGFDTWFSNLKLKAELENRSLRNELEMLRAQINPHFLFNTLNNIDTLIHTSPDTASKMLINLSELLRYMIYETQTDKVSYSKETEYIKGFVELQKLRFKAGAISLNIENQVPDTFIAPMLFIPFVENAFKYAHNKGNYPIISIEIKNENNAVYFSCRNTYNPEETKQNKSGGVGLENVKRRLELLYPQKHKLIISKENCIFDVQLILSL